MSAKKTKSAKTVVVKKKATKKPNALHDKLVKLFSRPNGATVHDTMEAGFKYPAMVTLRIVERKGYKVSVKKVPGDGRVDGLYGAEGLTMQWKLVHAKTGQPIQIGDELVTFRGEKVRLTGMAPPHKPEASGKVVVEHQDNGHYDSVYYVSVVGARYVRE